MNTIEPISIALGGDVMTGRGIDQILPHPSDPVLYEGYVRDAWEYFGLAVRANGAIPYPVDFHYVWGDALADLHAADRRIINLETSITRSENHWPDKAIHYRMHPENIGCLTAARIDCCGLANNHVLDWSYTGLAETLRTLDQACIAHAGAGGDVGTAAAHATLDVPNKGRILVAAIGSPTSGIPPSWAATPSKAGIHFIDDLSPQNADRIAHDLLRVARSDDVTVVSVHWGENWGYAIPDAHVTFAHRLVDEGIDIVLGHSSHHPKGIEIRRDHLILYGCGDFLNDYEGISGYEKYRDDLTLLYRVDIVPKPRRLAAVTLIPMQLRKLRLNYATADDTRWLCSTLNRESRRFGTEVQQMPGNRLTVSG